MTRADLRPGARVEILAAALHQEYIGQAGTVRYGFPVVTVELDSGPTGAFWCEDLAALAGPNSKVATGMHAAMWALAQDDR
jgi:hypothetical protein